MRGLSCVFFVSFTLLMVGCGADPLATFYYELGRYGYIPYSTPMQYAGTGTLIGGSPNAMEIIANPETCFPGITTTGAGLRFRDESVLPSTTESFSVTADLTVDLFKALATGFPTIQGGVNLSNVSSLDLEFNGIHVEYIDSVKLVDYYRNTLSETCKQYLDLVGFINQAIVADQMKFAFYDKTGGKIQITVDNIQQYLDLSAVGSWEIDQSSTLIINTPKYIGYQLGELREADNGLSLKRATKVIMNTWVFTDVGIFNEDSAH